MDPKSNAALNNLMGKVPAQPQSQPQAQPTAQVIEMPQAKGAKAMGNVIHIVQMEPLRAEPLRFEGELKIPPIQVQPAKLEVPPVEVKVTLETTTGKLGWWDLGKIALVAIGATALVKGGEALIDWATGE